MRKIVFALAVSLLCPLAAHSEALPFTRIPFDASVLGMGGAGLGTNALTLSFDRTRSLSAYAGLVSWMPDFNKTTLIDLGAAYRTGDLALSFTGFRGTGDKLEDLDFTPSCIYVGAGAAYRINEYLSAGINAFYARENVAEDHSYSAVATDLFVAGHFGGWTLSLGGRSLGSSIMAADGMSFSLPSSICLDAVYEAAFGVHAIKGVATIERYFSAAATAAIGFQYCYDGMLSARAGYHASDDAVIPSYVSAGLGLSYAGVRLDLAYLFASDILGGGFGVTLGYSF